jgi:pyridinium-3,5-bisthiocarboxylic acid mononucleotide nickel chelatase
MPTSLRGLHLHLDPVSGIAGDMTVAALVDAGVPAAVIVDAVAAVGVVGLRVGFESRRRGAFVGRGFVVEEPRVGRLHGAGRSKAAGHVHGHRAARAHGHPHAGDEGHDHGDNAEHRHRDYAEIRQLLGRAKLDPDVKALAEEIFARLAEVEAALHGSSVARVTFHEVGAFDSIADIVGMSAAIAWLAPVSIGSSPPVVGTGSVRTCHGVVPVPAPATAELLRGVPIIAEGPGELTTPTGAAFLATVVDSFGPPPPLRIRAVGYGAGTREVSDRPNVLRVLLGEPIGRSLTPAADEVLVLQTNIDDMSGQLLAALFDTLFKAGALDVWSTSILMKKGRPAQQVSALVEPTRLPEVRRAFFLNSTTLGLRVLPVSRVTLARSKEDVRTPYGPVGIKVASLDGSAIGAEPEFEDCRRLAAANGIPLRRIWAAAVAAASGLTSGQVSSRPAKKRAARRGATRSSS